MAEVSVTLPKKVCSEMLNAEANNLRELYRFLFSMENSLIKGLFFCNKEYIEPNRFVTVFLNEKHTPDHDANLKNGDSITIMIAIAGG